MMKLQEMFKFVFAFVLIVALAVGFASAGKACVDEPGQ